MWMVLKFMKPVFIKGKIKQGHEYKIAYLKNTKECVGFKEL